MAEERVATYWSVKSISGEIHREDACVSDAFLWSRLIFTDVDWISDQPVPLLQWSTWK